MNTIRAGEHPSEEKLMELAISGGPPEIREHAGACALCTDIVKEFRKVKEHVDSVGEEDVPERVKLHIALAVAIVIILLYFLVGSEVFREQ
jgi:hypothetical protein